MTTATRPRKRPGVPPELAEKLVIMRDVCARLNCARWKVYSLIAQGLLAVAEEKIGNSLVITKKSLDAYIRKLGRGV